MVVQLYIQDGKNAAYETLITTSDKNYFDDGVIESEIDEMHSSYIGIVKAISRIGNKVNEIELICDEYQLNMDDFISVNYDFDK